MENKDSSMAEIVVEVPFTEISQNTVWLRIADRITRLRAEHGEKIDKAQFSPWRNYQAIFSFEIFNFKIKGEVIIHSSRVVVKGYCPKFMVKTASNVIRQDIVNLTKRHTERHR